MSSEPNKSIDYVPPDVLDDILEAEREILTTHKRKKKPYPSNSDLVEAIIEALSTFYGHPDNFPDHVIKVLRSKGFETRHVTLKRIWRTYEMLVRKRVIKDKLGVVV